MGKASQVMLSTMYQDGVGAAQLKLIVAQAVSCQSQPDTRYVSRHALDTRDI